MDTTTMALMGHWGMGGVADTMARRVVETNSMSSVVILIYDYDNREIS